MLYNKHLEELKQETLLLLLVVPMYATSQPSFGFLKLSQEIGHTDAYAWITKHLLGFSSNNAYVSLKPSMTLEEYKEISNSLRPTQAFGHVHCIAAYWRIWEYAIQS